MSSYEEFRVSLAINSDIKLKLVLPVLVILFFTSCTTVEPIQALGHTWRAYERTVRWGDITGAVHFLREDAVTTAKFPKNIKNLKVTGYDVIKTSVNEDDMIAKQDVTIRYYNVNNFIEKSFVDYQEWKYDDKNSRWYLSSKLPNFEVKK